MQITNALYFPSREPWRDWLAQNFESEKEIWLIYPNKSTGKPCILYNDAVEEALCFGWIDSTIKKYDETHAAQRFTPRNPKSAYSQPNKERLKWLAQNNLLHPKIYKNVTNILSEEFVYPKDIIAALQTDEETWQNFQQFSESYKRIRVAYIHDARSRPVEFEKRLQNFLTKTKQNKKIIGHGGIDKYYCTKLLKMEANKPENIDQYIAGFDSDVQEKLKAIRKLVHETVPKAVETISYQMPAFKYEGRILVYFAAFKNHIGFYATPESILEFKQELSKYKTTKGTIQLPYDKPLPMELLRKIILYKAMSNEMQKKKQQ